ANSSGRQIVQIIFAVRRQFYFLQRMHVEVFAGNIPWQMRFVHAHGDEERFLALLLQLVDAVLDDPPLAQIFVAAIQRSEPDAINASARPYRFGVLAVSGAILVPSSAAVI